MTAPLLKLLVLKTSQVERMRGFYAGKVGDAVPTAARHARRDHAAGLRWLATRIGAVELYEVP
jgi:hypothetical protein